MCRHTEGGLQGLAWSCLILSTSEDIREGATRELPGPALNYKICALLCVKSRGGHPRSAWSRLKVISDRCGAYHSSNVPGWEEGNKISWTLVYPSKSEFKMAPHHWGSKSEPQSMLIGCYASEGRKNMKRPMKLRYAVNWTSRTLTGRASQSSLVVGYSTDWHVQTRWTSLSKNATTRISKNSLQTGYRPHIGFIYTWVYL